MFKVKFLRNFLILSLLIAVVLPLYEIYFIGPSYRALLVEETEDEAIRYAHFLVRSLGLEKLLLTRQDIPPTVGHDVGLLQDDSLLAKLRVFGPTGEIVFSTVAEEVGRRNDKAYFRDIVAAGRVYSKVVRKNSYSAERQLVRSDVVETYVPIVHDGQFVGAIEVYYDITGNAARIETLERHSILLLLAICGAFLVLVLLLLRKARQSIQARQEAEEALRQVNDQLDGRVRERTGQLLQANQQLTDEIAERTLAQMALSEALADSQEARGKIDAILASVDDGLLVTDPHGQIVLINPAASRLLAVDGETAIGRPVVEVIHDQALRSKVSQVIDRGAAGQQFDFELPGPAPDRPLVYQGRTSCLDGQVGEGPGIIILIQDVTRDREVERMKSEFLGMAAHELHTPLTTIIGYSELLTTSPAGAFAPEQQAEFLGLLHAKALALSRIVDDLLDISRIEAGQTLTLQPTVFVLDPILDRVVAQYRDQSPRHQFELIYSRPDLELSGDPRRIEQVLDNLLSNAVKYSPQGGTIRVVADSAGGHCRLRISDQGVGLTPEQARRIFERFYRADNSDTAIQGTGLGLSITRHIVEAHGGEIRVDSTPGKGTTVTVSLPLAAPE